MRRLREQIRLWSPSQRWLRTVALVGPVLALVAAWPAGDAAPSWLLLLVVLGSARFAIDPDSGWGVVVLAVVVGWWCMVPDDGLSPLVLLAAAAVLAAHVAGLLAAYGPGESLVALALVRRWVRRGGVALVAAPGVWLLAVAVRGTVTPTGIWTAGMLAAVLALLAGSTALTARDARADGPR